jgi:hypothetical protein
MSCTNYYDDDPDEEPGSRKRLDEVTRLLCGLCRALPNPKTLDKVPGLRSWWRQHKVIDERRLRVERERAERAKLREQAQQKLTKAKWNALNVDDDE